MLLSKIEYQQGGVLAFGAASKVSEIFFSVGFNGSIYSWNAATSIKVERQKNENMVQVVVDKKTDERSNRKLCICRYVMALAEACKADVLENYRRWKREQKKQIGRRRTKRSKPMPMEEYLQTSLHKMLATKMKANIREFVHSH
jgi:glutamate synthase domain-containing protein 3